VTIEDPSTLFVSKGSGRFDLSANSIIDPAVLS
jgi:hypothetical protein